MTTQSITVNVRQHDINEGRRSSCSDCPVARAFSRAINRAYYNKSTAGVPVICDVTALHSNETGSVATPKEAMAFMLDFDHERPVSPFSFTIGVSV